MKIELSPKDKIKGLKLPTEITEDLAYFCGVLAGDGSINERPKKDYEINCGGNPHNEREFYDFVLKPLIKKIFNLDVRMHLVGNKTTYGFRIYSRALLEFLTKIIGLPKGNKYSKLRIPTCFNLMPLKVAFLQGVADTDFSFTLKRTYKTYRHYPSIIGVSKSKWFIMELNQVLLDLGFNPCVYSSSYYDKRLNKIYTTHRIDMPGHKNIKRWMKKVGFQNPKYLARYRKYIGLRAKFFK